MILNDLSYISKRKSPYEFHHDSYSSPASLILVYKLGMLTNLFKIILNWMRKTRSTGNIHLKTAEKKQPE
jgi:hypothetical protein